VSEVNEMALRQSSAAFKCRNGLGNLKELLYSAPREIAYLGASVTAQKEGYRPLLERWFAESFSSHIAPSMQALAVLDPFQAFS
jgi:hypothetical protein